LDIVNTSGRLVIAQEGSEAGTVFIGTTAYASVIGTAVSRDFQIGTNNTIRLTIAAATGAATFSNVVTAQGRIISGSGAFRNGGFYIPFSTANTGSRTWAMTNDEIEWGDFSIITSSTQTGDIDTRRLYISSLGNIGIGTFAPVNYTNYRSLHISGNASNSSSILYLTNSTESIRGLFFAEGSAQRVTIGSQSDHPFTIITNDIERFRIANTGAATINNLSGSGNRIVVANSGGTLISAVIGSGLAFDGTTLTATGGASGSISGSGTSGFVPVFSGSSSISNSIIQSASSGITVGSGQNTFVRLGLNSGDWGEVQYSGGVTSLINGWASTSAYVQQLVNGQYTRLFGSGLLNQNRTSEGTFYSFLVNGNGRMTIGTDGSANALIRTGNNVDLRLGVNEDAITIKNGGNVLIGTSTDNGSKFRILGPNGLGTFFDAQNDGAGGATFARINASSFPFNQYTFANGNVIVGGSVTATSFFESSDATIKTLVEDAYQAKGIDSVVAKLYIKNGKQEIGYYAQDLEGVLPSAVSKGSNGLLNLSYREVHTAKIAYLEQQIKELRNELLKPS
jgi:hypothetical protein